MRAFLSQVPIPTGGVALGLAALGILLRPLSEAAYIACGVAAAALLALLAGRAVVDFAGLRGDFQNPILASVSATSLMAVMQLTTYVAPFAYEAAFAAWCAAVALHAALIVWFTLRHASKRDLTAVFPTYFICYVGIIVASVTSPVYGLEPFGLGVFWFGFAAYAVLLVVVTLRYAKHRVAEGARPLFCIYAAPMSLSLAGYLAVAPEPSIPFVCVLAVLAQMLLVAVLARLPRLLRLPFYPSYAAMTFPFVISATALVRAIGLVEASGAALPFALDALSALEVAIACAMVGYVLVRYLMHFATCLRPRPAAQTTAEARS